MTIAIRDYINKGSMMKQEKNEKNQEKRKTKIKRDQEENTFYNLEK